MITLAQSSPSSAAGPRSATEDHGLRTCELLLAQHLEAVQKRFGPVALGVIDLPNLHGGQLVADQIKVCAVLYWASEVERAGLVPFVEALATGIMRGTIIEPLGAMIPELTRFWRSREQRFAAPERNALFGRMFGGPHIQAPFTSQFSDLVQALTALGRSPINEGTGLHEARIRVLAQQLGVGLSASGTGIAAFAAREIVGQIKTSLRLLQHVDMARVFGGGTPWQIVQRHAPRLLNRQLRPDIHLTRAHSGMRIIAWIASEAGPIESGALRLPRNAQVIREAEAWSAVSGAA